MASIETVATADQAAAAWIARLDADPSRENNEAFRAWLRADESHGVAFARAQAMWSLLDGDHDNVAATLALSQISRRVAFGSFAALLVGGLCATLLPTPARATRLVTRLGEVRRFRLPDSTHVQLDTFSEVEVTLTTEQRILRVLRGGVWIGVLPGDPRPFVAETPSLRLNTVGAEFSVHHGSDDLVLISRGEIELRRQEDDAMPIRLQPRMRAIRRHGRQLELTMMTQDEVNRQLAWREGRLELNGERIIDAAEMFNRYNRQRIVIADRWLAQQTLVGAFKLDEPENFAAALAAAFHARVENRLDEIRLTIV